MVFLRSLLAPRALSRVAFSSPTAAVRAFGASRGFATTYHYSKSHEYVKVDGDKAFVGITDFAQTQLGDVVYVELPEVGTVFDQGEQFGSVESVKAASDVYLPVGGTILAINEELESKPEKVNQEAMTGAWFCEIKMSDSAHLDNLMGEDDYKKHCEEEDDH